MTVFTPLLICDLHNRDVAHQNYASLPIQIEHKQVGFIKEIVNNYHFSLNATLQWILDFSDLHISKIEMDLYHIQWPGLHCTVQKNIRQCH